VTTMTDGSIEHIQKRNFGIEMKNIMGGIMGNIMGNIMGDNHITGAAAGEEMEEVMGRILEGADVDAAGDGIAGAGVPGIGGDNDNVEGIGGDNDNDNDQNNKDSNKDINKDSVNQAQVAFGWGERRP
jgi:hypothetical protein